MKVLVYGIGVIGSLLVHYLSENGNDVTIIAREKRKEIIEKNGFCIKKGKKEWTDYPRVLSEADDISYDVTFSVMQNQQQEKLLDTLAGVSTKRLVLVGNNMTAEEMQERLKSAGISAEKIYFGFQVSGGCRYEKYTEVVTFGKTTLTLGHLHEEPSKEEKVFFKELFGKTMKLEFMDDMDGWYKCHMAFILPIAYIAYSHHCNLRECHLKDMKNYMKAGTEIYQMYQSLGILIRPKGDEKNTRGIRRIIYVYSMYLMGKTKMGEDAITNHCRNAVEEMEFMEEALNQIRNKTEMSLPVLDELKNSCPSWEILHQTYDKR